MHDPSALAPLVMRMFVQASPGKLARKAAAAVRAAVIVSLVLIMNNFLIIFLTVSMRIRQSYKFFI